MGIRAKQDVLVKWHRRHSMPRGGWFDVVANDSLGGAIDYDTPVNRRAIAAYADGGLAGGWGHGPWGGGPFGRASGDVLGYGLGAWGHGPWGRAGVRRLDDTLQGRRDGRLAVAVLARDAAGNAVTPATATDEIVLAAEPAAPRKLRSTALAAGRLALAFTRSADDLQ
jgi:hypothetical protein